MTTAKQIAMVGLLVGVICGCSAENRDKLTEAKEDAATAIAMLLDSAQTTFEVVWDETKALAQDGVIQGSDMMDEGQQRLSEWRPTSSPPNQYAGIEMELVPGNQLGSSTISPDVAAEEAEPER